MTKLLMLITSLAGGGAERAASELSINLGSNIKRKIVTLTDNISYPSNEPPISLNLKFKRPLIASFAYTTIIGTIKYRKLINKYKPEVSLSFLTLDNIINVLANARNKNTVIIVSVHTSLSHKFGNSLNGKLIKLVIQRMYSKANLIIAVSEGVEQELVNEYGISSNKIKVLYNPINLESIETMATEEILDEDFPRDMPIIINVGRLSKAKGQWNLIRAFSKVRERIKCKLCIIGTGPLERDLKNLTKKLNLEDDVLFLGWKDNPFKYISKSSLFVLSSVSEALPYALIEAMACGCPVISTNCKYGPAEILKDGKYGILIPSVENENNFHLGLGSLNNTELILADEIIRLLEDTHIRKIYCKKSKERAKNFSLDSIIPLYENILK